jgi:hypothetical protein
MCRCKAAGGRRCGGSTNSESYRRRSDRAYSDRHRDSVHLFRSRSSNEQAFTATIGDELLHVAVDAYASLTDAGAGAADSLNAARAAAQAALEARLSAEGAFRPTQIDQLRRLGAAAIREACAKAPTVASPEQRMLAALLGGGDPLTLRSSLTMAARDGLMAAWRRSPVRLVKALERARGSSGTASPMRVAELALAAVR